MLNLFEKLINEHGSSTILKERLTILKESYSEVEKARSDLESKNGALESELEQARSRIASLEAELSQLKSGSFATYVCDHCGGPNLKRTGSRKDPTFGVLGIKQKVFICDDCGQESAFTPEDRT